MKITATQYAKSLYEATQGKSQGEIGLLLENFVKILARNNQLKFKENILEKFEKIYNQENGIVLAEVISREKLNEELRNYVSNYVSNKYKAKEVIIDNKIDQNIQGGIIIKVGYEILDGSVEKQLKDLRKSLS